MRIILKVVPENYTVLIDPPTHLFHWYCKGIHSKSPPEPSWFTETTTLQMPGNSQNENEKPEYCFKLPRHLGLHDRHFTGLKRWPMIALLSTTRMQCLFRKEKKRKGTKSVFLCSVTQVVTSCQKGPSPKNTNSSGTSKNKGLCKGSKRIMWLNKKVQDNSCHGRMPLAQNGLWQFSYLLTISGCFWK